MLLVYKQAAQIIQKVTDKEGSARKFCVEPSVQHKKQTFRLVTEALRYRAIFDELFEATGMLKENEGWWKSMVYVLVYDLLLGSGLKGPGLCSDVRKWKGKLNAALEELKKKRKVKEVLELLPESQRIPPFPRYARVNILMTTQQNCIKALKADGFNFLKDGDLSSFDKLAADEAARRKAQKAKKEKDKEEKKKPQVMKAFYVDREVPNLLVFQPGTDLHANRLVKTFHLLLQDKASCLPAAVMMHKVPMRSLIDSLGREQELYKFIDGCSAPGNKTSMLAALAGKQARVVAVERDGHRFKILEERMGQLGLDMSRTTLLNQNFLDCDPQSDECKGVEGIMLDPSCTGSGIVNRSSADESQDEETEERVERLAAMQLSLLKHALSFPQVRRVVYSTCSTNQAENEDVVGEILKDEALGAKWELADIMPEVWRTRALPLFPTADHCIRCDPIRDRTNGFFVACFERKLSKEAAKKRRNKGQPSTMTEVPEEHSAKPKPEEQEEQLTGMDALMKDVYGKTMADMKQSAKDRKQSNAASAAKGGQQGQKRARDDLSLPGDAPAQKKQKVMGSKGAKSGGQRNPNKGRKRAALKTERGKAGKKK